MKFGTAISIMLVAIGLALVSGYGVLASLTDYGELEIIDPPAHADIGETITITWREKWYSPIPTGKTETLTIILKHRTGQIPIHSAPFERTKDAISWQTYTVNVTIPSEARDKDVNALDIIHYYTVFYTPRTIKDTTPFYISHVVPPPPTYTLATTVSPSSSGTVSPSSGTYDEGANVTITAYPNQGYEFSNWSGSISGSANPATVTMNSNKAITANFAELAKYTLTTNAYPLGAGSVSPSSGEYAAGESVTVTAYPSDEYVFDRWGGDASGTVVSTTIVMNSNKAVIAYFESAPPTTYNLAVSISPASGGYVNPDAGTFEAGALVTLTATAYSEYEFDHWSGDTAGSSETITVKMDSDKNIVANFKELPSVGPSNLFLYIGIVLTAFGIVGLVVTTKRG